jgi:hypothetical protein
MPIGKILSGSAAMAVVLCFFIPWISVSCGGQEIASFSGYELTTGKEIDLGVGSEDVEGDLYYLSVPLAVIVVIGLVLVNSLGGISNSVSAAGQITAASISLIILAYKWVETQRDSSDIGFVSFSPEIGIVGVVLGLMAIMVGAVISLIERRVWPS